MRVQMTLLHHDYGHHDYGGKIPKMVHEAQERLTHPHPYRPYMNTPYARGGFLGLGGVTQCATSGPHTPPFPRPHQWLSYGWQRNGEWCNGGRRHGKNSHRRRQNGEDWGGGHDHAGR